LSKVVKTFGHFSIKFLFGHFCSCQNLRGNTLGYDLFADDSTGKVLNDWV